MNVQVLAPAHESGFKRVQYGTNLLKCLYIQVIKHFRDELGSGGEVIIAKHRFYKVFAAQKTTRSNFPKLTRVVEKLETCKLIVT